MINRKIPSSIPNLRPRWSVRLIGLDVSLAIGGYGLFGVVEEVSDAEARHVMETNFFGTVSGSHVRGSAAAIEAASMVMRRG